MSGTVGPLQPPAGSQMWGSVLPARGFGGIMHVTGEPDGPPISVGLPICDLGTGMWAVQGILATLYERQHTGKGGLVKCSLLETAIASSSWTSAQWLADHQQPTRQGSRHPDLDRRERARAHCRAPKLGQQNAEIFRHLGLTDAEMHRLRERGVL